MKFKKTHILLIAIAVFLLISIGSVCASENVTADSDTTLADDGEDVVLSDTDENVLDDPTDEKIETTVETDKPSYEFKQDDSNKNITVNVKDNETKNVNVNKSDLVVFNGNKSISFEYNSSIVTITEALPYGQYNITINYIGNENYYNSSTIVSVKIYGNNTIETETSVVCDGKNIAIPVKIYDQVDYVELIKGNFNLTLVYTNETGNVCNLTINNTNFTIEDGKIKFESPVKLINASLIINYANATEPKTVDIKVSTEVKSETDKYQFKSEEIKNISIQVFDQENQLNVTKNDLKVFDNGTEITNFEYNNTNLTLELGVGLHNITVKYIGNDTYNESTSQAIEVKVTGNNTINVPDYVLTNGTTVEIPITIFNGVDNITIDENNLTVTLTYTNATGNITTKNMTVTVAGDKITFVPEVKLIAASATINYVNATEPKTVLIKLITRVEANSTEEKFNTKDNKTITVYVFDGEDKLNITAEDLKVLENGAEIGFTYNNSVITITTISEGAHNLTILYKGNDTYYTSNTTAELKVFGANQINVPEYVVSEDGKTVEIPIYIFNGLENITIVKENLTLNLTYTNATGNVTSKIIDTYNNGIITVSNDAKLNKASLTVNYIDSTGVKTVKIKISTSVEAFPPTDKYRNNETNNITVHVNDHDGTLNITKADLEVFDNGKSIAFTYNNSIINVNLTEGVHNITIVYKGNDTFNSSTTSIERRVYGDTRFDPTKSVILDESNNTVITLNLNDGADPVPIDKNKLNVTLFYTVGDQTLNRTIPREEIALNGQNITFKVNENFETAYAEIKYSENNLTANTTIQVNTGINASDLQKGETEVKNFNITVKGTNGHVVNITKDNIQVLNGNKALTIEVNGSVITVKDAFKYGIYNLTIKYLGDGTYLASMKNITLTVYGINATTSTNVNSSKKGEAKFNIINGNETVEVDPSKINLTVTYKSGNNTIEIAVTDFEYKNGTLYFTLENANFTSSATLTIKYDNTTADVTLKRIYNAKLELINIVNEYKTGNFSFRVVDVDDGSLLAGKTVKLTTVGNLRAGFSAVTDNNGIASFKTVNLYTFDQSGTSIYSGEPLEVGNHTVDLESDPNSNVKFAKVTTNLTITPAHVKIVVNPYKEYYGSTKNVTVTVKTSLDEPLAGIYVTLTIDGLSGTYNLYTNSEGTGQISIYNQETKNGLVGGDYTFRVSNTDTKNIANTTTKATVTVLKIPVVINAKDVTVSYNTGTTYTFKVTKNGKAMEGVYVFVRLYTTSSKYSDYLFLTGKNGQVSFSASLAVGKHKIIVTSADNRYEAKQVTKTITVKKASATITAKKVTAYYKGGQYFTVKVTNSKNKKPIYDAKVNIKVFVSKNRYYNYNGNTGMNGQLKLLLDTLNPGTYKVVVSSADDKNYAAKEVTSKIVIKKAPAKLTPKKLTAKKGAKKYFQVKVTNKKTKKVITGVKVKVKVYTGKKAKTYTAKTNAKGIAKISTKKLKVGKHKVIVTSANKYVVAKKAKSTIKIKK